MFKRTSKVLFVLLLIPILAVACGGNSVAPAGNGGAQPAASVPAGNVKPTASTGNAQPQTTDTPANQPQPTLPAVSNGENTGGGEAGGGVEAALVTYSDAAQGFAIGHPGPWTQDTSVTNGVKFVGGDDSMKLEFVTPPAGADTMTYAQSDVVAVSAAFPGFKQLSLAASAEVQNAIILGFTADGKSVVTGKTFTAHNERYYMPLADGRIAVLTVISPSNHYDQQGVRDIALTFKVTK